MLNQLILVGKITAIVKNKKDTDNNVVHISIDGKEAIPIKFSQSLFEPIETYVRVGYVVGMKGKLEMSDGHVVVQGEKVTFLNKSMED